MSCVHVLTLIWASVSSQLRRQRRRSLLSFLPRGGYGIVSFEQYCRLHLLQEVGHLAFTAQQCSRRPSHHRLGVSGGVISCPSCPKGVTASYRSANISDFIPIKRWGISRSRLDNAPGVRLVTAQEAAAAIPLVLLAQRGLQN